MTKRFPPDALAGFQATRYLRIRSGEHRFILIWVVVVAGRVIVRSWNDKPSGWYRAFLAQPRGHLRIGEREIPIRAVELRSKRLNAAADDAYAAKYVTKADTEFVEGFRTAGAQGDHARIDPRVVGRMGRTDGAKVRKNLFAPTCLLTTYVYICRVSRMGFRIRISPQTSRVLDSFLQRPSQWRYGYDLSLDTGLKSGTLYPILMRLAKPGVLETRWEMNAEGKPPRHMYRLTQKGMEFARENAKQTSRRSRLRRPAFDGGAA